MIRAFDVFRLGFAPSMTVKMLTELRDGCRRNDPALHQGCTTVPPPLMVIYDWKCEGGCAISYAIWKGQPLETVGAVGEQFRYLCETADTKTGEVGAFLRWFDDTPREQALKELADLIDDIMAERSAA